MEFTTAVRSRITFANLGDVNNAIGGEIATGYKIEDMSILLVSSGNP